jgi:hypothetical protein
MPTQPDFLTGEDLTGFDLDDQFVRIEQHGESS